jgi:alkylation response protein AidB-like acyl-CoA dehydrogenase
VAFQLTEEQREIRALAREFAEGEIRPHAAQWDHERELDSRIFGKLGELGFMGMLIPEEFGGMELDLATYLLVLEELAWADAGVALGVAIHSGPVSSLLMRYGSQEQKERHLPLLATGESVGVFALSEPGAGSDAQSLATVWERDGEDFLLNGTKKWITNGDLGGVVVLFAREASGKRISAFLVEPGVPGYGVGKREITMGLSASHTMEIELDGVRLPPGSLLGEEGAGFRYAMEALEIGRLGIAVQSLGIARAAFEHARAYARERVQFGKALSEFQATRFKLAEMATRITAARALAHSAAEALEGRTDPEALEPGSLAAMAKLVASETAVWTADEAVQIFGGYGYMREYPVEKLLRDAKGTEIYEGTNEIMRLVIARDVLRAAGA